MVRIRNLDTNNVREVKTIDVKHLNDLKEQRDQYKAERDTLIDDIAVLKANISRLEREKKVLHLQMNTYFDERLEAIEKYFTLTDHIRQKAEANPNVDRYIALVNYIDRLEKGES
ncbi:hypothetical protein [Staphylococcus gallinarum]|uniref:Uncharacterized protein n=1 Tax=Staphylococcus gallinarum TaxID=1293 RepID=A0A418HNK5_STAGA|nr:hypothetical protein [Staphylococcus gallinarum]PTL09924.1 hypothetical protein BUZ09_04585 [Staphylococcus gallinarum]RIL31304.1 hypothetical protein BUY98_11470 [Staphylococcus gallinarum]RIL42919.1 hypothetical protein BUZ01_08670 [Staphylococcus gallinarum]RIO77340.1 hypothetical protein BUZ12_04395 [Staphylococcus gallinarum]RIO83592.1 hypothetical protein BUZ11_04025 [Staphylococcus gallinarum]